MATEASCCFPGMVGTSRFQFFKKSILPLPLLAGFLDVSTVSSNIIESDAFNFTSCKRSLQAKRIFFFVFLFFVFFFFVFVFLFLRKGEKKGRKRKRKERETLNLALTVALHENFRSAMSPSLEFIRDSNNNQDSRGLAMFQALCQVNAFISSHPVTTCEIGIRSHFSR